MFLDIIIGLAILVAFAFVITQNPNTPDSKLKRAAQWFLGILGAGWVLLRDYLMGVM